MLQSIRSKILLAILAVTLVTSCAITMVFYWKSSQMIEENYASGLYARVEQTVRAMDDSLKEIYAINSRAAVDETLLAYAEDYEEGQGSEALDGIAELLRQYSKEYKDISSLYFVSIKEQTAVTSEDYPVYKKGISEEAIAFLGKVEEQEAVPRMLENLAHEGQRRLSCVQAVKKEGRVLGYLVADVEERTLFYEYLEPVYDEKVSRAVLADKNTEIIASKKYGDVGKLFSEVVKKELPETEGVQEGKEDGTLGFFCRGLFSECGLYLEVEKSQVLKDLQQMQVFLAGICFLFFLFAGAMAAWITRIMYRPVKSMTDTVEKVSQGDLSLRAEVTTEDEIGTLGREFNHMLDSLEDLIQKVIEEERLKKDAELEALQYQITPHFMYNTLNSIKFAALLKGEKELGGLIGDFVELLQASIHKKGTFLSVAEELHILKNYVHLQAFRYQDSFQVEYEVEEEAYGCYVPRLILQPLVENAILHGIDMKKKEGKICISGRIEGETLYLSVRDNGRGMTKEQIHELLHKKEKKTRGLSAVGVSNIRDRLSLYYGERGGLSYESSEKGTTAILFLPVKREEK